MLLVPKASAKPVFLFPLAQCVGSVLGEGQPLVLRAILPAGCPAADALLQRWDGSDPFTKTFRILRKGKTRVIVCSDLKSGSAVSPTNVIKLQKKIIQIYLKFVQIVNFT